MEENPHYKELLRTLNKYEVEYLIVGWVRGYEVHRTPVHEGPRRVDSELRRKCPADLSSPCRVWRAP